MGLWCAPRRLRLKHDGQAVKAFDFLHNSCAKPSATQFRSQSKVLDVDPRTGAGGRELPNCNKPHSVPFVGYSHRIKPPIRG